MVTDDEKVAEQFAEDTWGKIKDGEKEMKDKQDEEEKKEREAEDAKKKEEGKCSPDYTVETFLSNETTYCKVLQMYACV